jgi:hypothetical protein
MAKKKKPNKSEAVLHKCKMKQCLVQLLNLKDKRHPEGEKKMRAGENGDQIQGLQHAMHGLYYAAVHTPSQKNPPPNKELIVKIPKH